MPPLGLGRTIGLALERRNDVVQLRRPGIANPGEAAAAGEVEYDGFMKADANPVGDGLGHGASSGNRLANKLFSRGPKIFVYSGVLLVKTPCKVRMVIISFIRKR